MHYQSIQGVVLDERLCTFGCSERVGNTFTLGNREVDRETKQWKYHVAMGCGEYSSTRRPPLSTLSRHTRILLDYYVKLR